MLIYHGKFLPAVLNHERVTPDEIYAEMRRSGLERVEQVTWALLESDGKLSFIPLAPEDKHIQPRAESGE